MNEYECQCGYVWIDDQNYGCPMCGERIEVVRRDYIIKQPSEFSTRYERKD